MNNHSAGETIMGNIERSILMRRHAFMAGLCVAGFLIIAGCSSESPTINTPTIAAPDTMMEQAVPFAGAPKVPTPFPEAIFTGDPCADTLTPEQIEIALGAPVNTRRADQPTIGPGCDWQNTVTSGHAIMRYATKLPSGLSAIYENVKPRAEVWKPIASLQGFPAVAYVSPSGGMPDRFCQVSIGATDNTTIEVSMFLGDTTRGKKDPCDVANGVSSLIMTSLRAKAGI